MTQGDDFAFNDKATRLMEVSENGIKAYNPPLSKREYFAAMILQGLVSKYTMNKPDDQFTISKMACELADEFIKHLNA